MFDAATHIGQAVQCESALQFLQFDHYVNTCDLLIVDSQNSHQLTGTHGSSAACFGGFRSGVRARRVMHMAMGAHGEGPRAGC